MSKLTQEQLKARLTYDPETGIFTRFSGIKKTGGIDAYGYLVIHVNYKAYKAHRLAWLYVNGEFPPYDIDHINGIRNDNRIINLRKCVRAENVWNSKLRNDSTSGHRGVTWHSRTGKWQARLGVRGNRKHLGYFATAELASEFYQKEAKKAYGNFYYER